MADDLRTRALELADKATPAVRTLVPELLAELDRVTAERDAIQALAVRTAVKYGAQKIDDGEEIERLRHLVDELVADANRQTAEIERLRDLAAALEAETATMGVRMREQALLAGPYGVTQWTDDVQHADPCDCDLDNESVGPDCMANSDWFYVVVAAEGEWQRVIVRLPRNPPPRCEEGHEAPVVAVRCCEG